MAVVGVAVGVATALGGCGRVPVGDEGELGRANLISVPEVQEQPVRARGRDLRVERDRRAGLGPAVAGFAVGVDMKVGEVTATQGDQVSVGAEVGSQIRDRLPVLADGQGQLGSPSSVTS